METYIEDVEAGEHRMVGIERYTNDFGDVAYSETVIHLWRWRVLVSRKRRQ